jgi:hypothetical protein
MWEKFKLWTRVILFSALAVYLLIVITLNWNLKIDGDFSLMFVKYEKPRILVVLLITAVLSIFGWWLTRTIFKTVRQFRSMRERNRTARLEREVADMRTKAGMLQQKESSTAASAPSATGASPVVPKADPAAADTTDTGLS